MGEIQLEILQRMIRERFGLEVAFGPGTICYRETIAAPVEGIGHFEPLRHYAEVHLLLEPGERGSGLEFGTACPEDQLEGRWQRLVLTHLAEKEHLGVLTGSPITDMKITLAAGRAHVKHTEGGDFRQATYRAVRQGLMEAESILLEPWYDFRLELPAPQVGRAMTRSPADGRRSCLRRRQRGRRLCSPVLWPVSALGDYAREVAAYTQGRGRLLCSLRGYAPCADQDAVLASVDYDPTAGFGQLRRTPCSAATAPASSSPGMKCPPGRTCPAAWTWDRRKRSWRGGSDTRRASVYAGTIEQDKELQAIFERTYGPVKRRAFIPPERPPAPCSDSGGRAGKADHPGAVLRTGVPAGGRLQHHFCLG